MSNRLTIGERGSEAYSGTSPKHVEERGRKRYLVGKEVRVYYNPNSPNESVLKPGTGTITLVLLTIGSLLPGIGCFFLLLVFPKERRLSLLLRLLISVLVIIIVGGINVLVFPA